MLDYRGGIPMDNRRFSKIVRDLVRKNVCGAFVDQPMPWSEDKEAELEKIRDEAEAKLKRELDEVKGRYYWSPGKSTMINITLSGKPLISHYQVGGFYGLAYQDGVLTVNPEWRGGDALPSYEWGKVVDKMIQIVKQSDPISKVIGSALDKVEQKLGKKMESGVRQEIIRWCEKVAKGRLSAHAFPMPKGKEFVIAPSEKVVASEFMDSRRFHIRRM
jgi:hypothetical protein